VASFCIYTYLALLFHQIKVFFFELGAGACCQYQILHPGKGLVEVIGEAEETLLQIIMVTLLVMEGRSDTMIRCLLLPPRTPATVLIVIVNPF
jgi:hypothetical protein